MKSKEVLKVLRVTRPTLTKYVKTGLIKATLLPNGFYDYDEDSVLKLAGITTQRSCVVYARVSTQKQKKDLQNQVKSLTDFANANGMMVEHVYSDIASGLNFDRGEFLNLLLRVMNYEVKTVLITTKDRLTRVSFNLWKNLFKHFNCDLIPINELNPTEESDSEIFADIISLLHCFAMKMYSNKRKKKLTLVKEDLENEIGV